MFRGWDYIRFEYIEQRFDITDSFFFLSFPKRCILVIEQIILLNDSISILSSIPRYLYLISFSYSLTRYIRY